MSTASSTASTSSSSSSINCAGTNECHYVPLPGADPPWKLVCFGGVGPVRCEYPSRTDVTLGPTEIVPCTPITFPSSSSSTSSVFAEAFRTTDEQAAVDRAFVRVPDINDPGRLIGYVPVNLDQRFPRLQIDESFGWQMFFLKQSNSIERGLVTPSTVPTDDFAFADDDKVLTAEIVLPDGDGLSQYFVPVTERLEMLGYWFAQLQTPDWTILCLRRTWEQ